MIDYTKHALSLQYQATAFLLYIAPNGAIKLEVPLRNETLWLTQKRMAVLFGEGLPREIELRQKQYAYYRDLLLSFPKFPSSGGVPRGRGGYLWGKQKPTNHCLTIQH